MMKHFLVIFFTVTLGLFRIDAQEIAQPLEPIEGVEVLDAYDNARGYYLFYPSKKIKHPLPPVLFVHGYGALNPMIYGQWIRHLTEAGHCVIYPRYQENLFGTSPNDFVPNTVVAVVEAVEDIKGRNIAVNTDALYMIGHSYGGVIIANLAANWRTLQIPEPQIAMLCEPGSGPLSGGVLDSYATIDSSLHMAIIVGDNDETVGQIFGRRVYDSAVNTSNRVLLWQYACAQGDFNVSASHYEPYAIDEAFDNGIENFTSRKALKVARQDHVDEEGYWKIFDILVEKHKTQDFSPYSMQLLEQFADLGVWPDGTALRKMDCECPSVSKME